jgi:hypothetical protein
MNFETPMHLDHYTKNTLEIHGSYFVSNDISHFPEFLNETVMMIHSFLYDLSKS